MHEFVLSGARQKRESGVRTLDMAKRLLDYGFHPPTVYFPLLVEEAIMIEPTETEPLAALDAFAEAMLAIAEEAADEPRAREGRAVHDPGAPAGRGAGCARARSCAGRRRLSRRAPPGDC